MEINHPASADQTFQIAVLVQVLKLSRTCGFNYPPEDQSEDSRGLQRTIDGAVSLGTTAQFPSVCTSTSEKYWNQPSSEDLRGQSNISGQTIWYSDTHIASIICSPFFLSCLISFIRLLSVLAWSAFFKKVTMVQHMSLVKTMHIRCLQLSCDTTKSTNVCHSPRNLSAEIPAQRGKSCVCWHFKIAY